VHPVKEIGTISVTDAFIPVEGYSPYSAEKAFGYYESATVSIQANSSALLICGKKAKYNYSQFIIELKAKPKLNNSKDGYLVLADVLDDNDESVVASSRRMVFVKGTPPADFVKNLDGGAKLRVLGIPRVNLAEVYELAQAAGTQMIQHSLPYEMIVVGVYAE